jgi:hypothetical protein
MLTQKEIREILAENPNLVLWENDNGKPEPLPVEYGSPGYEWQDAILATEITHEWTYIQFLSGSFVRISADDWYKWEMKGSVSGISLSMNGAHYQLQQI